MLVLFVEEDLYVFNPYLLLLHITHQISHIRDKRDAEFQKFRILGSRIPDIIVEKFGHFWMSSLIQYLL